MEMRGRGWLQSWWMFLKYSIPILLILTHTACCEESPDACCERTEEGWSQVVQNEEPQPRVVIALLVRNKAHVLPYFLYYLQHLNYDKQNIAIWIRSDHNQDNSIDILKEWISSTQDNYHHIDFYYNETSGGYSDEKGPCDWSKERFESIIHLRQRALDASRLTWANYLFLVDVDNILMNENVLTDLIAEKKPIIAPMLNASASDHYSNFWCGMDEHGYYKRTPEYKPILQRHMQGVFEVPMVHSTLLIDLSDERTRHLAYHPPPPNYEGPHDDIIIFAHSAKHYNVPMYVINENFYGYLLIPMDAHNTLAEEEQQFNHMRAEAVVLDIPIQRLAYIPETPRPKTSLGFDQIYLINLVRRPDRRQKMLELFDILGINAVAVDAVDGKQLNETFLTELGVKMLPGYADPYHERPLTKGEIGCFLSHYKIWSDVLENQYEKVIVFEDDVRFGVYFKERLNYAMFEAKKIKLKWDLIYIGRKKLNHQLEAWVEDTNTLVWPHYSYWTLSYALSYKGAKKLIDQKPLQKMLPVDEYLPIMFNKHPEDDWKKHFKPRNLIGVSTEPLLVEPTHYTGEPGYITDTESSDVIASTELKQPQPPSNNAIKGDDGVLEYQGPGRPVDEL